MRNFTELKSDLYDEEGASTVTSREQVSLKISTFINIFLFWFFSHTFLRFMLKGW